MKPLSTRNIALVAVAVLAVGVFAVQNRPQEPGEVGEDPEISPIEPSLVTEVDMNMENWNTVDNESFTIKYPKEWHWRENGGGILMTNDPDYVRPESCVPRCLNDPEFPVRKDQVILFFSSSSPYDVYDRENEEVGVIEFTQKKYIEKYEGDPEVECSLIQQDPNLKQSIVKCRFDRAEERYLSRDYLAVNESDVYHYIFRTTRDTLINEKVFDMMMQSVVLKYHDYQQ